MPTVEPRNRIWLLSLEQIEATVAGHRVEPDGEGVYDHIDTYLIDFEVILVSQVRKWKWRMLRRFPELTQAS